VLAQDAQDLLVRGLLGRDEGAVRGAGVGAAVLDGVDDAGGDVRVEEVFPRLGGGEVRVLSSYRAVSASKCLDR